MDQGTELRPDDHDRHLMDSYIYNIKSSQVMETLREYYKPFLKPLLVRQIGTTALKRRPSFREWVMNSMPDEYRGTSEVNDFCLGKPPNQDIDRPTLAQRLDRVEEERDSLRQQLENAIDSGRMTVESRDIWQNKYDDCFYRLGCALERLNDLDRMHSDIEKCRVAMGTIAFEATIARK